MGANARTGFFNNLPRTDAEGSKKNVKQAKD